MFKRIGVLLATFLCVSVSGLADLNPDNVKLSPSSVSVQSSPTLPPEVRAVEAQTAPNLFDRDTTTEHTAYDASQIVAILETPTEVRGVKLYGAAPYSLSVQAEINGAWQAVAGLQNLNLTTLPDAWNSFTASTPVTTGKLRFDITLTSGSNASGIKAIEIWGAGSRVNVKSGQALLTALRGTTPPAYARLYSATPDQGVIGASPGAVDDPADNTFTLTFNRDPKTFKRAYLAYDVLGASHWIAAVRSINGLAAQGGFLGSASTDWSTQVEPINPDWLQSGANTVAFSKPPGATGTYTVRNVYVIAEFEHGGNFVAGVADNRGDPVNPAPATADGDLSTGWTPYPNGAVKADIPTLAATFDKPTQINGLALYLINSLKGSVNVEFLNNGVWTGSGAPTVLGSKLVTGWNTIKAPSTGAIDGLRLVFSGGHNSSAEIKEIALSGSGVGPTWNPPQFSITYPDAGQYFGRSAYIRGFLQPLNNGSGSAVLSVGGQSVVSADGAFGVTLSKDDVGLSGQGDSEAWSVEVKAVYPDGNSVTTVVTLNNHNPAVESTDLNLLPTYNVAVPPGQAKKISHDAATLDMPADALAYETTIGVTPLTEVDLPALDTGMTNVTKGPRRGYRFTPHPMKFKSKVKVTLPYHKALIPPGLTEDDVRTFYFDDQAGSWKVLELAVIDKQANTVTSLTDHFTDMINATVTVPDHPQTVNFNPTQLKDIKAADPGAQVNLIEAPKSNNQGDARLSYPIEIPPGRQGLQPQLAVQYSSGGSNGWMGMGWDVPMQAVSIDTRFGVPRYDADVETETYTLAGEQLTPVAHRGGLVARTADKVFHARVEGQFRRILRRGDHPSNYAWEVTHKNGTKYLYGATDPASETLKDDAGNVFLWALCEIRDLNGNFVKFRYRRVDDSGLGDGTGGVAGSNIYLDTITYTGHGTSEGPYSVTFVRDRDPEFNETRRKDVQIDARGGFKRVTADLLRRVYVRLGSELIRRYDFGYNENPYGDGRPAGAFNKTLLTSVSQFGTNGALFNKHTFTYYDEARDASGNYHGFAGAANWGIGDDGIGIGLLGQGTASAVGGTQSISAGGHLYVGIGPYDGQLTSKQNTGGLKVGFSRSNSETLIAMADMNGDGLPDKVFKGGGFFYRPNLSGPNGATAFGDRVPLPTLPAISRERVTSTTIGGELYFGLPVMLDFNRATTHGDTYFSDVNGDGLTDLVSGGQVLFGFVNAAGVPTFSANSADTPVPIGPGFIHTPGLLPDPTPIEQENAANFPLLDTLRRWVAPYDGVVSINAPVHLIQDTSDARQEYGTKADGVRVAIQLESGELWFTDIAGDDYAVKVPSGVNAVPVSRGDRIYFRVQSKFDGAFDQVAWDPEITYTGVDTTRTDVNDLAEFRYQASSDFTLAGRSGATVTLPLTGTLHIAGTFEKTGVTTDDVTLVITRNGLPVFTQTVGFAATTTVNLSQDLTVAQNDVLEWRILVDSPIDATRVRLTPDAYYTAADGVDRVTDENGNFVIRVSPPFDMDLYPATMLTAPQGFYTVTANGTLPVQARLQVTGDGATSAVFTVKRRGALLAKHVIDIPGTGEFVVTADVAVTAGDQLFFDLSSRDPFLAARVTLFEVKVDPDTSDPDMVLVPSAIHARAPEGGLFPQPYRGWGAAGYNGNSPRDVQPIDQTLLVLTDTFDPNNARAYPFLPQPALAQWGGVDELAWVKAGSASSSRLGLDDLRLPRSEDFAGSSAPPRISRSENTAGSLGVGASFGDSKSQLEFQDLNGDRFPDVISNGGVQFTRAVGGLEDGRRGSSSGPARTSNNESFNASTSGAGNIARAIADMRGGVSPFGVRPAQSADQGSDMVRLGFGGEVGFGTSETEFDLIDINGDGLPDKVFENGTAALNLGYSFASAEQWGGGIVNNGQTLNGGVNIGFNTNFYSLAGGLNLGIGTSRSDENYVDINGDGLPDKIVAGSPFTVRLNTGAGFGAPISWPGGHDKVAVDKHISLGGGVFFTFGFPIIPIAPVLKIVFNPGVHASTSLGRPEISFRDLDGDGFADQVFSQKDSELSVALNPIGRTNLLKKVHRPMGATIDLEYTRDGNTFDLPQSRWLMTKVTSFDGHMGQGADLEVMTYGYSGPKYNRLEREFYGYGTMVERHHDTQNGNVLYRSIQREYRTDAYYTKGLLTRELSLDAAGRPFVETLNTYVLHDVDTNTQPADGLSTTATIFPQLSRTDKRFYEGEAVFQKDTTTTHQYDNFGNVTHFTDAGDVGAQDDVQATMQYSALDPVCQASYVVSIPKRIEVKNNTTTMRLREATVDCATGDVTQVRQHLATGPAAVTDITYFPNGNIQSVTGPANLNEQRYRLEYEYDPDVATHVARMADSFGYVSTSLYDARFGKPTITTDINGQKTTYAYDTVGRVDTIVGPYEQATGQITIDFDYAPVATAASDASGNTIPLTQAPWAMTRHIDKDANGVLMSSGTIDTVLFTDGLKRNIQTKKDIALHQGVDTVPVDVVSVSGQVVFDAFGRTVQKFYPTTEPKGANTLFNAVFDTIAPTFMAYDVLDRNTQTTIPDGTSTTVVYGFGADRLGVTQFAVTVTDANGKVKQSYRDVRELMTSLKEFSQGTIVWTSYGYDALKQIVRVEDDKHNVTTVTYDNLGRRTIIDSPDTGKMETRYDLASNVIAKITATLRSQSKEISYNYDFTRLKSITYPNFPSNNVTYTYGGPGAPDNSANRITKATSEAGVEDRAYGPLGELTKQTWTIASDTLGNSANSPEVYTTLYQYDTWNRLMRMTYPDLELLTYTYDSGGLVNSAKGVKNGYNYDYLIKLEYDKFDQRVFIQTGNQVRTRYAYDERTRRLCGLTSAKGNGVTPTCVASLDGPLPIENGIQNLLYVYDKVGNILGMANSIPVPHPNEYGGPTKQTFVYDDLYRLTSAGGVYNFNPSKTRTYNVDLAYDSIHNILSKAQSDIITQPSGTPITQKKTSYLFNYAYGSSHPHAPTHIGNRTYSYDANGNQLGWDHDDNGTRRTIVWDEENRIQSIFDNGHEKFYKYDDEGERIIKRGPQGETVYVNQFFTIRNREVGTKHVFTGKARLVSKLMKQDKPGANPNGKTPVEKDLYFFHSDHLGSSHYITDTQGKLFEHLEYFPFGETWVEESSNTQRTPYLFTGKELDEETGLYYYGARYYDPRTSVWQSADPVLGKYLPDVDDDEDGLPGLGGIYNSKNLGLYSYGHQNPIIHKDPDGNIVFLIPVVIVIAKAAAVSAVTGAATSAAISAGVQYATTGQVDVGRVGRDAAIGAVIGGAAGTIVKGAQVAVAVRSATQAAQQAKTVHQTLHPIAQNMRTTAVASQGSAKVATGSGTNALTRAQGKVAEELGATASRLRGARVHAEPKALSELAQSGARGDAALGASRNFCPTCVGKIKDAGGAITGPATAVIPTVNYGQAVAAGAAGGAAGAGVGQALDR